MEDMEIIFFTEPANMSPLQHADALLMRALLDPQVYDENVLERTFLEGLPASITDSISPFRSNCKPEALQELAYQAM